MKICRCCGSVIENSPILEFKNMPSIAQNFPDAYNVKNDKGIDLDIYQCSDCGLIQILQEPVYYYRDVIRAVSVSEEMKKFRKDYFEEFFLKCNLLGKKVIEIGAGCGEYMQMMNRDDVCIYGIEHLKQSVDMAQQNGLKIYEGFVENRKYKIPEAPYDGFVILNFLEHIPDAKEFLRGIAENLTEGAYGLVEVPNTDLNCEQEFFNFMLDHLSYFTEQSLTLLLQLSGFEVLTCNVIWHDSIISAIVRKRSNCQLEKGIEKQNALVELIKKYLENKKKENKKVAVWGASHQALAIMSMTDMQNKIECVIDSAIFKQNKYTPATHIPIVSPKKIEELNIEAILVMASSYTDEVCKIINSNWNYIEVDTIDSLKRGESK